MLGRLRGQLLRTLSLPLKPFCGAQPTVLHLGTMPPIQSPDEALTQVNQLINANRVMIFSKSYCPFCTKVKGLFSDLNVEYYSLELDQLEPETGACLQNALKVKTGMGTVPNVFVRQQHIGGCDATHEFHQQKKLLPLVHFEVNPSDGPSSNNGAQHSFDYDLVVIGGGSGGLAASKAAAKFGKKVAVFDFVKPTPLGTTWGLGGTCVNVGCIPKKLMHQGALIGQALSDAPSFGWETLETKNHKWETLVQGVQDYIGSLNWGYRVSLKEANVTYLNQFAQFEDEHTLVGTKKNGAAEKVTSNHFLVAVGGRPKYPDIPGAKEFAITSDDLFSLPHNPGKTLCIGASYIALECAGFLHGLGIETTIMVRSIFLRGFDQQVAEMLGEHMQGQGIQILREWVPLSIEKLEDSTPPRLRVRAKQTNGDEIYEGEFNTVVIAIGRDPCTSELKLENAGVKLSPKTGKVITNEADQSSVSNIFAIGDVAEGRPELTPVAIQAGQLLAKRLYGGSKTLTDYTNVPTTVFTPMEYGCIGLSEEDAIAKYGEENIEVYHTNFQALEHALPQRDVNSSYAKLVCLKPENEKVLGFHYVGNNAGEVTQGFGIALRLGATKADFDAVIGIHPTCAENFTSLDITKSSGVSATKKGC